MAKLSEILESNLTPHEKDHLHNLVGAYSVFKLGLFSGTNP